MRAVLQHHHIGERVLLDVLDEREDGRKTCLRFRGTARKCGITGEAVVVGEVSEGVAVGKDEHGAGGRGDCLLVGFVQGGKFRKIGRRIALIECGVLFIHGAELVCDRGDEDFGIFEREPDVFVDLVVVMIVLSAVLNALLFGERPIPEGVEEVERAHLPVGIFEERSCPFVRLPADVDKEIGVENGDFIGGRGLEVVEVGARIFEEGNFDVLRSICEFAHPVILREDGADDLDLAAVFGIGAGACQDKRECREGGKEGAEHGKGECRDAGKEREPAVRTDGAGGVAAAVDGQDLRAVEGKRRDEASDEQDDGDACRKEHEGKKIVLALCEQDRGEYDERKCREDGQKREDACEDGACLGIVVEGDGDVAEYFGGGGKAARDRCQSKGPEADAHFAADVGVVDVGEVAEGEREHEDADEKDGQEEGGELLQSRFVCLFAGAAQLFHPPAVAGGCGFLGGTCRRSRLFHKSNISEIV